MKSLKNKFIKVCSILLIVGIFVSCGDDFLSPKPLSTFMPENTYTNKEAMIALLNECRNILKNEFLLAGMMNAEYNTSDLCIYGEMYGNGLKNLDVQMTPDNVPDANIVVNNANGYWNFSYASIKSANVVISRHDKASYHSEEDKNAILAEGYFHRAYWYYRLVHQYGDVPFIGEEVTKPVVDLYTTSRKSILNHMVKDMEFAVQHLPVSVQFGEVSRAAGNHLLTKLYLSVGRFDDAVRAATEVIEKSGLALMKNRFGTQIDPVYREQVYEGNVLWDLFRKENISIAANTEGILISQDRVELRNNGASGMGSLRTRIWGPNVFGLPGMIRPNDPLYTYLLRGQAFARPSPYTAYTLWANSGDDLRHTWPNWFSMDRLYINDPAHADFGLPPPKPANDDSIRNWFPFQYYKIYVPDEVRSPITDANTMGGYTDFYVFRLAETYLLRAEAYWWNNNLNAARDDINEVRGRANAPLITATDVTIDYILDERARELFVEEPRKTELTRVAFIMADQGRDGYSAVNMHLNNFFYDRVMRRNEWYGQQIQTATGTFKMSPYHYLWPVPQSSINANTEGHINQNMGYYGSENNIPPLE